MSTHGAYIRNAPSALVGARGTLTIDGAVFPLQFTVPVVEDDGLRLEFAFDEATAAKFAPVPERLATRQAA